MPAGSLRYTTMFLVERLLSSVEFFNRALRPFQKGGRNELANSCFRYQRRSA